MACLSFQYQDINQNGLIRKCYMSSTKGGFMTKTVYITELKEIKGLKVVCKCGSTWYLPSTASNPPEQCISCKAQIPGREI